MTSDSWAKVGVPITSARKPRMQTLAIALTIGLVTAQAPPSLDNEFETVLGMAGLSTKTARFDPSMLRFFRQGEFMAPLYESCYQDPWRIPFFADMWRRQFAPNAGRPSEAVANGARMLGPGTRRTLLGNPIQSAQENASKPGALLAVLQAMKRRGIIRNEIPDLSKVPPETQQAAALVLQVAMDSLTYRRAAFNRVADLPGAFSRAMVPDSDSIDPMDVERDLNFMRNVDLAFLFAGSHDVTLASTEAQTLAQAVAPNRVYAWRIESDWGAIQLTGGSDSTHKDLPTLLSIDTGGNDVYVGIPANHSVNNWASVVIDTQGADRYLSDEKLASTPLSKWEGRKNPKGHFGPGGAAFGYCVLVDSSGNDVYRTHRPGIGSASFGSAVVLDREGDDLYDAYANSEGFGRFGVGLVEDMKGNDQYSGFNQVQGHGGTEGFGMILDRSGDDIYVSNDETIDFPSPQSKDHNVSMSQGAGNGRRADYLDGHSLAGGIGILFDQSGNDKYSCGVFGQGVGYWEGIGLLWDGSGDDSYVGQWYVQGAAAHFAIGYLEDEQGTDSYSAPMNMAQGAGHDFSIGFLKEGSGADTYKAPNLSLGAGNANGLGIFVDSQGNDHYDSSGITLGKAAESTKGSLRERCLCLGVFMDLHGQDTFPAQATWAKDASQVVNWTDRVLTPAESQLGVFFDR